jgi:hypothetical protein
MKLSISNKARAVYVAILILVAYGVLVSEFTQAKFTVMGADVISGIAVIGIAVLMYPLFLSYNKPVSKSYLILKYAEGILMVLGGLVFLSSSELRTSIYDNAHIYTFIISGALFYYLLYISKLVPRFISIWGALGIAALSVSTFLGLFDVSIQVLDYFVVLVITNEVFLAGWLIIKGFNPKAIKK